MSKQVKGSLIDFRPKVPVRLEDFIEKEKREHWIVEIGEEYLTAKHAKRTQS